LVAAWHLAVGAGPSVAQSSGVEKPEAGDRPAREAIVPDSAFDEWAFGGKSGASRFRDLLERMLRKKVIDVDRMFLLTDRQRQKLRLAGHGDIKRLLEKIEDTRREFDLAKSDPERLNEVRKTLRSLESMVSLGPFEFGSLFDKTLRKMFNENQLTRRPPAEKKTSERA
jgi:hypothetical protein